MSVKHFLKNKINLRTPVIVLLIIGLYKISSTNDIISWIDYVLVILEAVILFILSETSKPIYSKYNSIYKSRTLDNNKKFICLATHSIYIFVSIAFAISIIYNLIKGVFLPSKLTMTIGGLTGLTLVIVNILLNISKINNRIVYCTKDTTNNKTKQ